MAYEWAEPIKKCCVMPQRYVFGIMGFFGLINIYLTRICLSVAITEMVTPTTTDSAVAAETTADWSEFIQGIILSSFYVGYIPAHIPGGLLAEKYGGKHVVNGGIFLSSLFTLLTPPFVKWFDYPGLVVCRILEGVGQGTTFPAMTTLLAHWVPLKDRSKMGALVLAGNQIGSVITNMTSGYIIEAFGTWESVFYIFGIIGVVWSVLFQFLCFSDPSTHPFIKDDEKEYLLNELVLHRGKWSTPWYGILRSMPLWSMVIGHIGHDWILFAMITDLPKYMKVALKFTVAKNGLYSALPYILMWIISIATGFVADCMTMRKTLSMGNLRKLLTTIAQICPALFILAASYAGEDKILVISFFTLSMGTMGTYYSGIRINPLDLSPNYAGTLMAFVNGTGSVSGLIIPLLIGYIVGHEGDPILLWRLVFWITFAVAVVTTIFYIIFGSGKIQYWNDPTTYQERRRAKREAKLERARERAARNA